MEAAMRRGGCVAARRSFFPSFRPLEGARSGTSVYSFFSKHVFSFI
jgi:hypothetical protein